MDLKMNDEQMDRVFTKAEELEIPIRLTRDSMGLFSSWASTNGVPESQLEKGLFVEMKKVNCIIESTDYMKATVDEAVKKWTLKPDEVCGGDLSEFFVQVLEGVADNQGLEGSVCLALGVGQDLYWDDPAEDECSEEYCRMSM